jgi:uncharacterized protein YqiB (DUF1249 family)
MAIAKMASALDRPPTGSIGTRVQALIDEVHGGNVVDAALALEIPRRSLAHLASAGPTYSPRIATLQRIAEFYNVRLEWLMTGNEPRSPESASVNQVPITAATLAFADVLRVLDLPADIEAAYTQCAYTAWAASRVLVEGYLDGAVVPVFRFEPILSMQVSAWSMLLREMIRALGRDEARARLILIAPFTPRLHGAAAPLWSESGLDIIRDSGIRRLHKKSQAPKRARPSA